MLFLTICLPLAELPDIIGEGLTLLSREIVAAFSK